MKRIQFTHAELDLINDMAAIACASAWGEGDYQAWTKDTGYAFDSLRNKVWELLLRSAR